MVGHAAALVQSPEGHEDKIELLCRSERQAVRRESFFCGAATNVRRERMLCCARPAQALLSQRPVPLHPEHESNPRTAVSSNLPALLGGTQGALPARGFANARCRSCGDRARSGPSPLRFSITVRQWPISHAAGRMRPPKDMAIHGVRVWRTLDPLSAIPYNGLHEGVTGLS